jgi:uncharacterized Zn finger protein
MDNPITRLISPDLLMDYAGEPSFSRGVEYAEDERVTKLQVEESSIKAMVRGTHAYHVELWEENGELSYSCTCPLYQKEIVFCKHCVAAGLAVLDEIGDREPVSKQRKGRSGREMTMKDVKAYLETQDKATLISLLLRHAEGDERLQSSLLMKASSAGKKLDVRTFEKTIDRAVDWGDFVDYKSMHEYSRGIADVIESLNDLLEEGHADDVIQLSEYFLKCLEGQIGMVDDSDGYLGETLYKVQELHHAACVAAKPDPEQLARRLFEWELQTGWDVFYGAVDRYADVFGERGLAVYRELAEAKWASLQPLGPGEDGLRYSGERFHLTSIMEQLAIQTGDIEKLVAIKTKDLSTAYSYLEIAELYQGAGKADKALEWAENGVKAFPQRTDSRLREFLANQYHKGKRHDEAVQLVWTEFTDFPGLEQYKLLKSHAERAGGSPAWQQWREKALVCLRDRIADANKKAERNKWIWHDIDHSVLVEIFLWENDVDAAWLEAQEGGCQESLWLTLAGKREREHPEDALAVYQSLVEPTIEQRNNVSYAEAIELIRKIGRLLKRLDREEEWLHFLDTLRLNHRRKRNFMALLAEVG